MKHNWWYKTNSSSPLCHTSIILVLPKVTLTCFHGFLHFPLLVQILPPGRVLYESEIT